MYAITKGNSFILETKKILKNFAAASSLHNACGKEILWYQHFLLTKCDIKFPMLWHYKLDIFVGIQQLFCQTCYVGIFDYCLYWYLLLLSYLHSIHVWICIWYNCPSKKWCCDPKENSRLRFLILMEMMSVEHSTTLFQRRCLSLSSSFKLCISHKKGHALKALRPKGQSPLNMMHKVVCILKLYSTSLSASFPQNSLSPITQKWPSKVLCFWGQLTQ